MRSMVWLFIFLLKACRECQHFIPFGQNPSYGDMGKCALYKDMKNPGILGYAEGARCDDTKCGRDAVWFKRKTDLPLK